MFSSLQRRSSWPSSLVTGLVGWISFSTLVPLAFGYSGSPWPLLKIALVMAVLQILILRLAFFALRLDRGLLIGALWGGVTGALLIGAGIEAGKFFYPLRDRPVLWLVNGVYIGMAVGAFLSYFHRDDREIEESTVGAAVLFRNQESRPSLPHQLAPESAVVSGGIRHHLAHEFG